MRLPSVGRLAAGIAVAVCVVTASCGRDGDAPPRVEEHAAWGGHPPPEAIDGVRSGLIDRGIQIVNGTDEPIFYAVWALSYLGQFVPCTEASGDCLRLDRGARVVVPLDAIVGNSPDEREAVVRWWRVETDAAGGRRPHDLHVIGVPLAN